MIKFGIIGMGVRGKLFLNTIRQNSNATVVALSETNPETAKAVEEEFGVKCYLDFKEMIDSSDLDAVIVATPDFLHREPVIYAANSGLHILVEKPFATTDEDSEAMLEAIEKAGVTCMTAFENRWNLPIAAAKDQIKSGALGDILNVNARLNNRILSPTKNLKWSKDSSVGWFLFPHIFDMIYWFNGGKKVKKVYAVGTKKKLISMGIDVYDTLQATVTFEDDTNATLTSTWILPNSLALGYDLKLEVVGSESAMYINTHDQCVQYLSPTEIQNLHTLSTPIDGYLTACPCYMTHHFIHCLVENVKPEADAKLGAYNTKVICAIHKSADLGGQIIEL